VDELYGQLRRDGVIGLRGAFDRSWVWRLGEDLDAAFLEALDRPGGPVLRGLNRYYVEIDPGQMRGFGQLATHPWVSSVCAAALGPAHRIVEVGFEVRLPGTVDQPWHRDGVAGEPDSLTVHMSTVDTEPDMAPFEIVPGSHLEDGADFVQGVYPPEPSHLHYEARATRMYPQMGDIYVRSPLTVHRVMANRSDKARPVLVLRVA
jgi:hypothetical protein